MINPITGWLKITQYKDKIVMSISKLVETTCLSRYPRPMEITYDQGSEFIGHEFSKSLIEGYYWMTSKPSTSGNITKNAILERINQVLVNLVLNFDIAKIYVDKDDP